MYLNQHHLTLYLTFAFSHIQFVQISLKHKKNHIILPHLHLKNQRKIDYTSEVLIIQKGKIQIDLYSTKKKYLFSKILKEKDIIMLVSGGHGFKILKDVEMIEIKQGPFNLIKDKIKFDSVSDKKIKIKK